MSTKLAPRMRKKAMSSANKLCAAEARATTMKDVQMSTVTTAAVSPRARGESFMAWMIGELTYASRITGFGALAQLVRAEDS